MFNQNNPVEFQALGSQKNIAADVGKGKEISWINFFL